MNSAPLDAYLMSRGQNTEKSRCSMALLPPETKIQIMSYISSQQSLSRLGQSCRAWYGTATQELYTRDAKEHGSFAMKWMAAHAVDDQTTDSAIGTLWNSRRWGGQIDAAKRLSQCDTQRSDKVMYESSTALHFAVFLGNMRLTKTILDMEASLIIPCPALLWTIMGAEELLLRARFFQKVFEGCSCGPAFPIFLAFLQSDPDMCKLLIDHGAGREAIVVDDFGDSEVGSILHLAAADMTTNYRQWQFLFDRFREYINEPSPGYRQSTPLHVALTNGCAQGMQLAVETGADKESRDSGLFTPMYQGVSAIPLYTIEDPKPFEEHMRCLQKFVDLGGSVNPEGLFLIGVVVSGYASFPDKNLGFRHLLYFLLEHHADINEPFFDPDSNMVNDIIDGILRPGNASQSRELLKELLGDLVDRGLNLTTPAPPSPVRRSTAPASPLYRVLVTCDSKLLWLVNLLCENGATIYEYEVDKAFICWCKTWRLWGGNKYHAWWQHQGQEDETFQKWCEDPYSAWWWQHVEHISRSTVITAYQEAFCKSRQLYDILTHLPLPRPSGGTLVQLAFFSRQPWSWSLVVQLGFEENVVHKWSSDRGDSMIHDTVRLFILVEDYSAADATRDILHLSDKGVKISSRDSYGDTPLDILLRSGSPRDGFMELAALLEGKVHKVHELA